MLSYMSNGKDMIIHLTSGLKKYCYIKWANIFWNHYELFGWDINVKMDLSNYITKADLKNVAGMDTLKFVKKFNLAKLNLM